MVFLKTTASGLSHRKSFRQQPDGEGIHRPENQPEKAFRYNDQRDFPAYGHHSADDPASHKARSAHLRIR